MAGVGAHGRWLRWGLDRMTAVDVDVSRRRGAIVRTTTWEADAAVGPIRHRQAISIVDGAVSFAETVEIPKELDDLPRVGVRFVLPETFEHLEWFGPGPGDSYPDRRTLPVERWATTVTDTYVDHVVPQEHGHRTDVRWFELSDGSPPPRPPAVDGRHRGRSAVRVQRVSLHRRGPDDGDPLPRAGATAGGSRARRRRPSGPRHGGVRARYPSAAPGRRWTPPLGLEPRGRAMMSAA